VNDRLQLETPSLVLRPLAPGDAPRILEMSREPCARRWLPSQVCRDARHAAEVVAHLVGQFELRAHPRTHAFVFGIVEKADGRLVGHVGLSPLFDAVEVGFGIAADRQGRGYATEAVGRACGWALEQFSLPAILGVTDAENVASQRVLVRSGFRRKEERRMRLQGVDRPVVIWELTASGASGPALRGQPGCAVQESAQG